MANPVVSFPDAVLVVVDYIRAALSDVTVATQVPDTFTAGDEMVTVRRVGGFRRSIVTDRPRVDIRCWAGSEEGAYALMARVRPLVLALSGSVGGTTVYDMTEVGGPQNLPDAATGSDRYAFAVEFTTRGA